MAKWSVIYEKSIREDGTLFFPQKLSKEFLDSAKKTMGSYIFANQYQNEIIPEELQSFKKHWIKTYERIPKRVNTFAMIDPAIGQNKNSDYTGIVVVDVDEALNWYVKVARRERLTPTQIMDMAFQINDEFKPLAIGIESVAYQKALIYLISEEMTKRKKIIPLKEILPPNDRTKEVKIRGPLVPRYEWGRIFHAQGLYDLETELLQFPRGSHDDLIDALASIDQFVTYPEKEKEDDGKPRSQQDPRYEKWFIRNAIKNKNQEERG